VYHTREKSPLKEERDNRDENHVKEPMLEDVGRAIKLVRNSISLAVPDSLYCKEHKHVCAPEALYIIFTHMHIPHCGDSESYMCSHVNVYWHNKLTLIVCN
jgi:hypothetical protein